jgi:predicted O-methyltransferase YrrM
LRNMRARIAMSPLASIAALPERIRLVARYDARVLGQSVRWLVRSREHTNFTYDLTPLSCEHLTWLVAEVTGQPVVSVRRHFQELQADSDLASYVMDMTRRSQRWRLADPVPRYGLRMGWYGLVRALQPEHVVETGTDKGLGACVIAAALLRNGHGRLTTIDLNPDAGYLINGRLADVVDLRIGDSLDVLPQLDEPIHLFLHEVHCSAEHERAEYEAIGPLVTDETVLVSDNAERTSELAKWAEAHSRRFLHFHELPADHWYPGSGMCVAFPSVAHGSSGSQSPQVRMADRAVTHRSNDLANTDVQPRIPEPGAHP